MLLLCSEMFAAEEGDEETKLRVDLCTRRLVWGSSFAVRYNGML